MPRNAETRRPVFANTTCYRLMMQSAEHRPSNQLCRAVSLDSRRARRRMERVPVGFGLCHDSAIDILSADVEISDAVHSGRGAGARPDPDAALLAGGDKLDTAYMRAYSDCNSSISRWIASGAVLGEGLDLGHFGRPLRRRPPGLPLLHLANGLPRCFVTVPGRSWMIGLVLQFGSKIGLKGRWWSFYSPSAWRRVIRCFNPVTFLPLLRACLTLRPGRPKRC